ncbi:MAG: aspartate carbamoyltransferase regulatory subunit [Methanobacteriaceae archaeon]|nr:aspartate carbamoyltransferase regulatory subunit [Methanobacteriaceae archaeon]
MSSEEKPKLKVIAIKNGTVIDHIAPNKALQVLKILNLPETDGKMTLAMNISSKYGSKDLVKIENRELDSKELDKISLIAPKATINIIRDYKVVYKEKVRIMDELESTVKCTNPKCISNNKDEPITSKFSVVNKDPITLRCHYCERLIESKDIEKQFKF